MKALVKKQKKSGLWKADIPLPQVGDDEVLIKVRKTSICGTDVHIYKWDAWAQKTVPTPMVIGHEFMGEIAALGKNVRNLKVGQRVTGEGHITCGTCSPCLMGDKHLCMNTQGLGVNCPGCFAELFTLPASNVFPLPADIPDDIAAIFDPYGNATHTALSYDLVGEDVLITGAGPIGIMAAAIAKKVGARTIVVSDINPYRLELASKMGATHTVDISKETLQDALRQTGLTEGFTIGLEMSGSPAAVNDMLATCRQGAGIALLGILPNGAGVEWDNVIFKMLRIKGIYGREIFSTWFKMTHLIESGLDIAPVITHQFSVDDYEKGFEIMIAGNCGKVILNW